MFGSGLKSKRTFDIAILVLAHIMLSPIWLILWIVIPILIWAEDKGAIFFRQKRVGFKGSEFKGIKFRSFK